MESIATNPADIGEMIILATGCILLVAGAVLLTVRGAWRRFLSMSPLPTLSLLPTDAILALVLYVITGQVLLQFMVLITGSPVPVPGDADAKPRLILLNMAAQLINGIAMIALILARLQERFDEWGLRISRLAKDAGAAGVAYLVIWPICTGLLWTSEWLFRHFSDGPLKEHTAIETMMDAGQPAWIRVCTILSAVVLAPFAEEVVFRGVLFRVLANISRSPWTAALMSGVVFGLIHISVPQTIPALAFFGIALAFIYAKSGSLTRVILLHALFNAKTVAWIMLGAQTAV